MMTDEEFKTMQKQNCAGKVSYDSIAQAEYVMKYVNRKFNKVMKIYICPCCHKLHLTTDKQKSPKKEKQKSTKTFDKVKEIERL